MRRIAVATATLVITSSASGQLNQPSTVPGSPPGFNYPIAMEAVTVDPKNHRVLYRDDHIRLLEVTLWPGDKEAMHGHAYPSVFAFDAIQPAMVNDHPPGGGPPKFGKSVRSDGVPEFPRCQTMGPQNIHAATVQESYPQHFYRMEFVRLDGDNGFDQNWRKWYPAYARSSAPQRASAAAPAPFKDWPFPASLEDTSAAPANYRVIYDNDHIRLTEVMIRPGETVPLSGSPYPSVLAYDTPQPDRPGGAHLILTATDPAGPQSVMRPRQMSAKPDSWNFPTCEAVGPIAPYRAVNAGAIPAHYYRIEFKWVDGNDFPAKWQTHFPAMAKGPPSN